MRITQSSATLRSRSAWTMRAKSRSGPHWLAMFRWSSSTSRADRFLSSSTTASSGPAALSSGVTLPLDPGQEERRYVGRERSELSTGRVVAPLPAMATIELAGRHLKALAAGLDRLVHGPGLRDRHIAVVGGNHEHRRHGELLDGGPGFQRDAADQARRVGLARDRDHRGDRGPHPGPGNQDRRATHGCADQRDPGHAAAAQLGHGGGQIVDHPATGVAFWAGRPPKAAQEDVRARALAVRRTAEASPRSPPAAERCRQMTLNAGAGGGARTLLTRDSRLTALCCADSRIRRLTCAISGFNQCELRRVRKGWFQISCGPSVGPAGAPWAPLVFPSAFSGAAPDDAGRPHGTRGASPHARSERYPAPPACAGPGRHPGRRRSLAPSPRSPCPATAL